MKTNSDKCVAMNLIGYGERTDGLPRCESSRETSTDRCSSFEANTASMTTTNLTRFAWLSIAAALVTLALKFAAWFVTGSVGLLSDALESMVNLGAAAMALAMLTVAARPPDEMHAYGYSKAEYFSSGIEGALVLLAAMGIAWTAIPRLVRAHAY